MMLFLWMPLSAAAGQLNLEPYVDLTGGYDDNVYYRYDQQESDYVVTGRPGYTLDYKSELFNIRSRGSVEFLRYLDNSNLNRENYNVLFDGGVNLTERWTLRGDFSFINDTTLDSQLEETGIVTVRTDRKRYNAGGELAYRLTEVSNAGAAFNHQSTRYGSERYEDYDYESVRAFYDVRFNNGLDVFTVMPYFGYWDSDVTTVNNYGLSFGLAHTFSETLSLEVFVGPRYTRTERKYTIQTLVFDPDTGTFRLVEKEVKASDNNWGGTGNIQLKKNWLRTSATIGYSHDLTYSSSAGEDAEPINVDRFFFTLSHRIKTRLRVSLSGSYYISESASSFFDDDRRYMTLRPSIEYDLTRNYGLRLTYVYSREFNERVDTDRDRNRVWLAFTGKWPMRW